MKRYFVLLSTFIFLLLLLLVLKSITSVQAQTHSSIKQSFSPDEVIVKYKTATSETAKGKIREKFQTALKQKIDKLQAEVLHVPSGRVQEFIPLLKSDPNVEYAEPNYEAFALATTNDTALSQQWGLFQINAANSTTQSAWDVTTGGASVKIAILDTGIEESHPDLFGKVTSSKNFTTSSTIFDQYGHGTHVAGIAAATTNNGSGVAGVGYNTALLNGKVLGDDGSGYNSWIASGITWAADQGAQVISMSLGGPSYSKTLEDAVNYAWSKGSVVVAAAGNDGNSNPSYPGYYTNAIAVAATDSNDTKASWSNYGNWVDVAAPGINIYSTYKGSSYATMSGTSMATPFAAGTAALLWMKGDCATNVCVRDRLEKTADSIAGTGTQWTWGRVNAYAAVTQGLPVPATPTATLTPTPTKTPTPTPTKVPSSPTSTTKPNPSMSVSDMSMTSVIISSTARRISSTITVLNEVTHAPVSGALVKVTITMPGGSSANYSGTTNSSGKYTFKHRSTEKGTFVTNVTNVTKAGFTYHPTLTSKSLLVQ